MELAGEGALMALFEKLTAQLEADGLFEQSRARRPLPFLPKVIGVVPSPTGAVIRHILHRPQHRCPPHFVLWPLAVHGPGADATHGGADRGFEALAPGGGGAR